MPPIEWNTIVSVIATAGLIIVALITYLGKRRESDAKADEIYQGMALELAEKYGCRLEEVEFELKQVQQELKLSRQLYEEVTGDNKELWQGVFVLLKQIDDEGMRARWMPSESIKKRYGVVDNRKKSKRIL